jgi:hypothetical protein
MSAAAESNVWSVSLDGKTERAMTNLAGKNGRLGGALGTDQHYLYFTWYENPASDTLLTPC